ncbi:unnamed protein product [Prunus armeniaca]
MAYGLEVLRALYKHEKNFPGTGMPGQHSSPSRPGVKFDTAILHPVCPHPLLHRWCYLSLIISVSSLPLILSLHANNSGSGGELAKLQT